MIYQTGWVGVSLYIIKNYAIFHNRLSSLSISFNDKKCLEERILNPPQLLGKT
jgi:hypothetical protein